MENLEPQPLEKVLFNPNPLKKGAIMGREIIWTFLPLQLGRD